MLRGTFNSICTIILIIIFIISTYFIWNQFNNDESITIAQSYSNIEISYYIENVNQDEENNIQNIHLKNNNGYRKTAVIYFRVDSNSINQNTNVKINDIDVRMQYEKTVDNYDYYSISTINLNQYEEVVLAVEFVNNFAINNYDFIVEGV